jgi:hypothetical protein
MHYIYADERIYPNEEDSPGSGAILPILAIYPSLCTIAQVSVCGTMGPQA